MSDYKKHRAYSTPLETIVLVITFLTLVITNKFKQQF